MTPSREFEKAFAEANRNSKAIHLQNRRIGFPDDAYSTYEERYTIDAWKGIYLNTVGFLLIDGHMFKLPLRFNADAVFKIYSLEEDVHFFKEYHGVHGELVRQGLFHLFGTDDVKGIRTLIQLKT